MERLKQMSLKKSLFTITFINTTTALILSLLSIWGCVELRSRVDSGGIIIEMNSDSVAINKIPEPSVQADVLSDGITVMQILLPIVIDIIALFATASLFYRLKLKEPLAALTKGASRIIDNDLNFTIETKSPDELGQLCIAFETMRKTLLANNYELWRQAEERKRLNAAFSHNLRNPVTVLKGSAKLARNTIVNGVTNTEQLAENLLRIESYTGRIEQYVETMSSIQKLEDIPVAREMTKWDSLTSELENMIRFLGADYKKQITFTASSYAKDILIDKSILFQIAENLVSNALRFAAHSIDIFCSITDGKLSLSVTDDGCGFPAELLQNGIQPFQKGKEEAGHFGMGLYTCELLCRKHGGNITIQNNQTGATITAFLTTT